MLKQQRTYVQNIARKKLTKKKFGLLNGLK
jgi:hypothetical protein